MKQWIITLVLCLAPFTSLATEANQTSQAGRFYVNPMVGGLQMESSAYDPEVNYSLGGGYNYNANLSSEFRASYAQEKSGPDGDVQTFTLGALYHLLPEQRLVPYLAAGIGVLTVDQEGDDNDHHLQLNYGAGLKYFLNQDWAVNTELRHLLATSGEPNNLLYSAGVVYFFGGEQPAPAPATTAVAVRLDSDGDGIYDDEDRCPNTPAGMRVDTKGCLLDSDGDGVYETFDQCPNTARGMAVDNWGCPLDSDGDGVYDDLDKCPNSAPGARVDQFGCQIKLTLLIQFDTDKEVIRPQHFGDMANAAAFISAYPGEKILIAGHTDSDGSEAYNQRLSQKRAQAVLNYLVSKHNIDATHLTARGFGESQPVASNATAAGKQQNRRVELSLFNN